MTDIGSMTTEEALAHYGVKGMRWGVSKRPTGSEIHSARARVNDQASKVRTARKNARKAAPGQKGMAKANYEKQKTKFLNNPDRVTAMRMTRGEAAINAVLLTPAGFATVAGLNAGVRRRVAKKQATGAYDKK